MAQPLGYSPLGSERQPLFWRALDTGLESLPLASDYVTPNVPPVTRPEGTFFQPGWTIVDSLLEKHGINSSMFPLASPYEKATVPQAGPGFRNFAELARDEGPGILSAVDSWIRENVPTPYEAWMLPNRVLSDLGAVGKDIWHNWLGFPLASAETETPPEGPIGAPASGPNPMELMLQGALAGSGTPRTLSIQGGKMPPPTRIGELIDQIAKMEPPQGKAPEKPEFSRQDMWDAVMLGLAAGAANTDPRLPRSHNLLQLGMGAAAGRAGESSRQRDAEREHEEAVRQFENEQGRQTFADRLSLLSAQMTGAGMETEDAWKRFGATKPMLSGNTVVTTQVGDGGNITYDVTQMPSAKDHAAMQFATVSAMNDIPTLFQQLALKAPEALDAAAEQIGVDTQLLRGVGLGEKSVDLATQARIINYVERNAPQFYAQLQQMAAQEALMKYLMKR